jgi:hypothetical protein
MATEPKLANPTHEAMSAVEQALSEQLADGNSGTRALPQGGNAAPDPGPSRPRAGADPARVVSPDREKVANDDRQEVGLFLQALKVRPSRSAYLPALLASAVWLGGLFFLVASQAGGSVAAYLSGLGAIQQATLAAVAIVPVVLFLVAAMLAVGRRR